MSENPVCPKIVLRKRERGRITAETPNNIFENENKESFNSPSGVYSSFSFFFSRLFNIFSNTDEKGFF